MQPRMMLRIMGRLLALQCSCRGRIRIRQTVCSTGIGCGLKRGSLTSGWSAYSAYVQLPAPPAAPSKLTPNGAVLPADEAVTLSWQHNPIDSSDQVLAEVRWRTVGDEWTTEQTPDATFEVTPESGDFEWQVRTRGGHAEFGAWSPTATFQAINKPTVSITQPDSVWEISTADSRVGFLTI